MARSLSLFVLAGLVLGLIAGIAVRAASNPALTEAASVVEALGGLWLNALRMTVIPLIVALLITSVGSIADAARTGGLVARFVALFSFLILAAALYSLLAADAVLALWPVDSAAAAAFVAGAGGHGAGAEAPSFAAWLQGLAPSNPVKAAAEDAVLPLVVFALFFGFALTRIDARRRAIVLDFFRGVADVMVVIVHWVLRAGLIGVFALAIGVGVRAGAGAAGVLVHYVLVVAGITAGVFLIGVVLALTAGRQPIARYAAATAPVWAIALSTQSSIASLPAMLEAARQGLGIPARVADVVLPLAVAVFRFTSPVANLAVVAFIAHLYGHQASPLQIISAVIVAYGASIAAIGLPGQVSFIASIAPITLAYGLPTDLLGILIAVEVVPDIFRTLGNCAGDLAATTILARHEPPAAPEPPEAAAG